jgi:hypothetical protein
MREELLHLVDQLPGAEPSATVIISFEEYQRLKHAPGDYQLAAEITTQISQGRQHPERRQPRPRRASRQHG